MTLRLPPKYERKLTRAAKKRGIAKVALVREAVIERLADLDDVAEAEDVLVRVKRGTERVYTSADVKRELGL